MDNTEEKKNDNKADEETAELPAEDELTKCQKERGEYLDGWKRAKADLANYKKDEAKRLEFFAKFSQEALIRELINVLDSFDLALIVLGQSQTGADYTQTDADKFPRESASSPRESARREKGLYLIRQQLEDILRKSGLERIIVSVGQPFNPATEEAIAEVESDKPAGTIIEEVERGYTLNGKVVRPARVKVSK